MIEGVNTWAGRVVQTTILINGKPVAATVRNGDPEVAGWLESGQPLTESQRSYIDSNYYINATNAQPVKGHSAGLIPDTNVHAASCFIAGGFPTMSISYQAEETTGDAASTMTSILVSRIKALNAVGADFNFLGKADPETIP